MRSVYIKVLLAFSCGAVLLQIGCGKSSDPSSVAQGAPIDEVQFFENGLKGQPTLINGSYRGERFFEFNGQGNLIPFGTLTVEVKGFGNRLELTYSDGKASGTSRFNLTIVGNTILDAGIEVGKIGAWSFEFEAQNTRYKFLRAVDSDLKTPVLKITEMSGIVPRHQGNGTAIYKAIVKKQ